MIGSTIVALRWVAVAVPGATATCLGAINWIAVVRRPRGPGVPSLTPLLAGILGAVATLVAPSEQLSHWWWVPFLVDGGSIPGLLAAGWILRSKRR